MKALPLSTRSGPRGGRSRMQSILELPTFVSVLLVSGGSTLVVLATLLTIRRRYGPDKLKENHEVAGIIFNAFGWLYAVIVAFTVFVTWTGYDDAAKNLQLEASQTLDVFHSADAFTSPLREEIRRLVLDYLQFVADAELPHMANENMSLYSVTSLRRLDQLFNSADSNAIRNRELYSSALHRLDSLMEYRRLRIFSGRNTVPPLIWLVLLIGGTITIANTFFFGMKHLWVQSLLLSALTLTLSLILFLIFVLDHPFTGANRVDDDPLREALGLMKQQLAAESR